MTPDPRPARWYTIAPPLTPDIAQELDGGKAAVPHRDHPPSWQPAYRLQQPLPGPVGQLLMPVTSLSGIAFGGREHGQEGQSPHAPGPRDRGEQHHAQPAQAAGFDKVAMAGPHRIPIDPARLDLGPQRRSMVSSRPITTGPCGTRAATRSSRRRCAMARDDQRPRLSTRWETANPAPWSRPMTRSAAVMVRRPGARTTPATRTRTWRQTAGVKEAAKGCIHAASTAGTLVGMAQAFL